MMHQVNFLPWRQRALKRKYQRWGYLFCLQLTVWTAILAFIYVQQTNLIKQNRGELTEVQQQLAKFQRAVNEIDQAILHHQHLIQQVRKKREFMEQNQRYLQLFRQLPQLLPEKSWLTAFSDNGGQLIFSARSQDYMDISDMLDNLTEEPQLINIQLQKMTTTEDQLKVFNIDANWLTGESNGK
ncbi:PilN domain-containing protein [Xenorhabdus szentirmaii]|uniref:PilN domain-containing protein n=1 Tax=Xenorhabdus szentirmaii TaxID=290112 RepID=UPI0019BD83B4|nr:MULTISPECIES: PilN domain-containing protein [unclassified Xenorhabdus]MBD2793267.1 PilN domain-containing protein [Xenorhabdus sp. CUL]MBD2804805.1 PilN domain-containing protein [Xenorhabdus sp. ZM]MBD2825869.1 PilN domain-containing protein [Xenorhabdus sp. 5]